MPANGSSMAAMCCAMIASRYSTVAKYYAKLATTYPWIAKCCTTDASSYLAIARRYTTLASSYSTIARRYATFASGCSTLATHFATSVTDCLTNPASPSTTSASGPTACVTGGWGEPTHETGNCHRSEPTPKNAQSPSRPAHTLLGRSLGSTCQKVC